MGLSYVWFITVFIFMGIACICLFYFSMNPYISRMHLSICIIYIKFYKSSMCIYFNCMQFKKMYVA
jgi:hypothetical protein